MNVSTREFQLNQKEYLEKVSAGEKIILTNRGIPVAEICKAGETKEIVKEFKVDESQVRLLVRMILEEIGASTNTKPIEDIPGPGDDIIEDAKIEPIMGWCQLHFEKGKNYPIRKISYEDENGNELIKQKWACPKCIGDLENKGVGRVYFV